MLKAGRGCWLCTEAAVIRVEGAMSAKAVFIWAILVYRFVGCWGRHGVLVCGIRLYRYR
jgi:hypothetical protein